MYYAAAFGLFSVLCIVLAFRRHPIWGLYFYLATTFVYPPARWWGYVYGNMRWALLAALVTALAVVLHRGKLQPKPLWVTTPPAVILGLFALWLYVQSVWALLLPDHLDGSVKFVKYMLAFWFVYRVVDTPQRVVDFLMAHVLGCTLLGLYAQFEGRVGGRLDGVGGPGIDDANTLGMYLVTGVISAVGLFMSQKGWRRWLSLLCLPLIANGFVLANSRGALLGLVAGSLVLAFCKAKRHRAIFWGFALASLLSLGAIVDQTFVERMFSIKEATAQTEEADNSSRARMELAKAQMRMFLAYPMGTGHRGTVALSRDYLDHEWLAQSVDGTEESRARSSHNTFLSAMVEQGIPGALLYLAITLWCFGVMLRLRALDRAGVDPGLVTLGASVCGALAVVWMAGHTADYLMAEVQFWLFAALVSVMQFSVATLPPVKPQRRDVPDAVADSLLPPGARLIQKTDRA